MWKRNFFVALAAGAMGLSGLRADRVAAEHLMTSHEVSLERWMEQMGSAKTENMRRALLAKRPSDTQQLEHLWRQVERHLDEEWVLPALGWMLERPAAWSGIPESERVGAFNRLMDALEHSLVISPKLGEVLPALSVLEHQRCLSLVNKIIQVNPTPKVKAQAHMAAAIILRRLGEGPKVMKQRREHLRQALELGGDASFGKRLVLEMVQDELYRVKNLTRGRTAPVFTLRDKDGLEVSLLNYRGRVTVLVFWDLQSTRSLQHLPVMNALLEGFGEGRDEVALLGVVTDPPSQVNEFAEKHRLGFDNLVDPGGRVARRYRIERLPTVFILDREGKISYAGELSPLLRPQIEELVQQGRSSLLPPKP